MGNIITPIFRMSFVHLNKPRAAAPEAAPKYSVTVVLDNDDAKHMEFLDGLREKALEVAKEKFGAKLPKKLKLPFRDGDEEVREEWENSTFFTASASEDYKPGVVDANRDPIIDAEDIYSGMWGRCSLRLYAWAHETGGKGVSVGLVNVQKTKDDEPFGGTSIKAEEEFSTWSDEPVKKTTKKKKTTRKKK